MNKPGVFIERLYKASYNLILITLKGRVAYIPWDIVSPFWKFMSLDHSKLLNNTILWALNEEPIVLVSGPGLIEVTAWRQKSP